MFTLRAAVELLDIQEMRQNDRTLFEKKRCSHADHVPLKMNRDLWMERTIPRGLTEDIGDDGQVRFMEVACCVDCGSMIAWHKMLTPEEVENGVILP